MRFYVTFPARNALEPVPTIVELIERDDGTWQASVDGRSVALDVAVAGAQISMRLDGRVMDVTAHGRLPNLDVVASGMRARVRVESERARSLERANTPRAPSGGSVVVKSPMPGRVVRVLVAKGQRIEAGQGLLVLEAMKMENEVRSTVAATVADVLVTAGAVVEAGARLMMLVVNAP